MKNSIKSVVCSVRCPHRILALLLFLSCVAWGVPTPLFAGTIRYPITINSGGFETNADTIMLPPGMTWSNVPGGGRVLIATNLTTGAGSPTSTNGLAALSDLNSTNSALRTGSQAVTNGLPTSAITNGLALTSITNGLATSSLTNALNGQLLSGPNLTANNVPTNFVGLTFYVSKLGSDSNPGTQMSPFLTLSNAVAKLSSNVYVWTTYQFAFSQGSPFLHNLTNQTFTFGSNLSARTTLTFLGTTNSGNQILIHDAFSSATQAKTNALQLGQAVTNEIPFPPGTTFAWPGAAATFSVTTPTGAFFSVSNDMTNYCSITSNQTTAVTNFGPYAIIQMPGTYDGQGATINFAPNGGLYGYDENTVILTNFAQLAMSSNNTFQDFTAINTNGGTQMLSLGTGSGYAVVRRVNTTSPFDGVIGGAASNYIYNLTMTSAGDGIFLNGVVYIWDSDLESVGPQIGYTTNARGDGLYINGNTYVWNTTFFAGGNGTSACVLALNGVTSSTTVDLHQCSMKWSNGLVGAAIANYGSATITEIGCFYAKTNTSTVGTVLHGVGPYTININGTTDSSGVITGYFPSANSIIGSTPLFPTNNTALASIINSYSGSNAVTYKVYTLTTGAPLNTGAVVGTATGYDQ